jgi:lysozyme
VAIQRLFNAIQRIWLETEPSEKTENLEMTLQNVKILRSSPVAHTLIKEFEQCRLAAYLCPAHVWTIGWGHTKEVRMGDKISLDRAERLFQEDIAEFDAGVADLFVSVPLDQHQFDALVCFAYNTGLVALENSTLLKLVREGNIDDAAAEFEKWVSGGRPKRKLRGLVRRRKKERALFEGKYNC